MEFVESFLCQAREIAGYEPADGAVLAVSGGPDSMALIGVHRRLATGRFVVAHLDHHLRAESADDAAFVREQAAAAEMTFVGGDWSAHRQAGGIGIEAAARAARYRFLATVAQDHGLSQVVTGHHRDDQIETVLHRILRGTGPEALRGIHPRRHLADEIILVRPMLGLRRVEILEYLNQAGIPFRVDPTNSGDDNLRATIRNRLLPYLERAVPELSDRLEDLSSLSAGTTWPIPPPGVRIEKAVRDRPLLLRKIIDELLDEGAPPLESRTMGRIRDALGRRRGIVDLGRGYRLAVKGATVTVSAPDEPSS